MESQELRGGEVREVVPKVLLRVGEVAHLHAERTGGGGRLRVSGRDQDIAGKGVNTYTLIAAPFSPAERTAICGSASAHSNSLLTS